MCPLKYILKIKEESSGNFVVFVEQYVIFARFTQVSIIFLTLMVNLIFQTAQGYT